jgi:hypothetical protein
MSQANPSWGAPRIHEELLKLGIAVAQSTVVRYLPRPRQPPSQTWRTFLTNHLAQTAAIDFFTVPTATFRVDGDDVQAATNYPLVRKYMWCRTTLYGPVEMTLCPGSTSIVREAKLLSLITQTTNGNLAKTLASQQE